MRVCVLSSGSKGNCSYIETSNHKILIDIGNSSAYVERSLKSIGVEPSEIDMILISHAHVDHIAGLRVFSKKYAPKVYMTEKIFKESGLNISNVYVIPAVYEIDGVKITSIKTSHDTEDSNGYIVEENGKSCVYITDTGYINKRYFKKLYNKNIYIFESNHDPEMLMNNPRYPHHTKIRIIGDTGHLSNQDSAYYLSEFIGPDTKIVYLAHLSEQNNREELAFTTLKNELKGKNIKFSNIKIAKQNKVSEECVI